MIDMDSTNHESCPIGSTELCILDYLSHAYDRNPEAEVSGAELQHELSLDADVVQRSVSGLAHRGLVEWDPLLSNIWLRITDKGLATARN